MIARVFRRSRRAVICLLRREHGTAMAELAVVFPLLILVAIGVADFGRVYYRHLVVTNAARAGAEWGALRPANAFNSAGMIGIATLEGQEIPTLRVSVPATSPVCKCAGVAQLSCATTCASGTEVYVSVIAVDSVTLMLTYPGLRKQIVLVDTATFRQQ